MSDFIKEKYFEADIENYLITQGGYTKGRAERRNGIVSRHTMTVLY